jgi:hypothetical protein
MTDVALPTRRPIAWPMLIRKAHLWMGMLIAPSVLMFAFSGALQIFRLQESRAGYVPPSVIEKLGRLHKDQVYAAEKPRAEPAPGPSTRAVDPVASAATPPRPGPTLSKQMLQWFFTLASVGLILSTFTGIWMGAMVSRWKRSARWMLVIGAVLPMVLVLLPF